MSVVFPRSPDTRAAELTFKELELRDLRNTLESLEQTPNIQWRSYARECADIWWRISKLSENSIISVQTHANKTRIWQLLENREVKDLVSRTDELYNTWNASKREFNLQGKKFQEDLNELMSEVFGKKIEQNSPHFPSLSLAKITLENMKNYKEFHIPLYIKKQIEETAQAPSSAPSSSSSSSSTMSSTTVNNG